VLNSLKIPLAFLITGICWALFSDHLIAFFTSLIGFTDKNLFRSLNDVVFVIIIAFVLYFEIKKHELKLFKSEEEYRHLFESNPNPMWIYNKETLRFIKVNNAAIEKYGYNKNRFLRMTIKDIRPAEEHDRLTDYIKTQRHGIQQAGIWKHIKGNKEIFNVSIISHPVIFNEQCCELVMATDITELLDKETKLQRAYRKIKTANAALLRVSWSNSHELRKPLCSILGLINLMKESIDEQEKKEILRLLEECSLELDKVVRRNNERVTEIETQELN
jgi:PAS domain S-box-containing protein